MYNHPLGGRHNNHSMNWFTGSPSYGLLPFLFIAVVSSNKFLTGMMLQRDISI